MKTRDFMHGFERQDFTLDAVKACIEKAREKGAEAAAVKVEQMYGENCRRSGLLGLCGGGLILIELDNRRRLGRQLKLASKQFDRFRYQHAGIGMTKVVSIYGMHKRQEREVDIAAKEAAFAVLKNELHVVGRVKGYFS